MPIPLGILAVAGAGAAGGGGFDLLETTVLGTAAASVRFESLGSYASYKHLQIRIVARGTGAGTTSNLRIELNDDAGNNYNSHYLQGNGSTVSSFGYSGSEAFARLGSILQDGATANSFVGGVLDILDFSNANKNTTLRNFYGYTQFSSLVGLQSSVYLQTNAITSVDLFISSDSFKAGSRFSLYGIK